MCTTRFSANWICLQLVALILLLGCEHCELVIVASTDFSWCHLLHPECNEQCISPSKNQVVDQGWPTCGPWRKYLWLSVTWIVPVIHFNQHNIVGGTEYNLATLLAEKIFRNSNPSLWTHWGRMTQICVFNTRLFSLHNTLNYAIHRACLRMILLTDVYRNLTSLWINL